MSRTLVNVLSEYNENPENLSVFFKQISQDISVRPIDDNLFLICNNYETDNLTDFYRECRSTVLLKNEDGTVEIYAQGHPNIIDTTFDDFVMTEGDTYTELVEGTNIMVFNHDDKWYIITKKCTDIDKSFFNPSKSFGQMFDECLLEKGITREQFLETLDKDNYYELLIVHHENKVIGNYVPKFGENYKVLCQIQVRKVKTFEVVDVNLPCLSTMYTLEITNDENKYNGLDGFICERTNESGIRQIYRVLSPEFAITWKRNPNYYCKWYSMLQIFINNEKMYNLRAYMRDNNIEDDFKVEGKHVDLIGMFSLLYKISADVIMHLILHFTVFDKSTKSFTKRNGEDYEVLNSSEHSTLRRLIATLQELIRKNYIRNNTHIINFLRKKCTVRMFVHVLRSIKLLEKTNFCTIRDSFYAKYRDFLLLEIDGEITA